MPKGFLPNDDTGQLFVFTQAAQDIGFDAMVEKQRQAATSCATIRTSTT